MKKRHAVMDEHFLQMLSFTGKIRISFIGKTQANPLHDKPLHIMTSGIPNLPWAS